MSAAEATGTDGLAAGTSSGRSVVGSILVHGFSLVIAATALTAHEHYRLLGQSTPALMTLVAAGGFALVPLRALVGELFEIEGEALHLVHGVGGLAFIGLSFGGVISGAPLLNHAALAPFAIMGAAQAVMHQNHPRNAAQAEALRRFASSLPEIQQIANTRDLASPANATRAVRVLTDIISKAQALGETELQSDPGFKSALKQVTARSGLALGLDTVNEAIDKLATNPAASSAIPGLRERLAAARRAVAGT